jgi:outer membrane lipase/esterase
VLVPNLPTLSLTPAFSGSPAAPLANAGVAGFNTQLYGNLFAQAAAHPNTNIILMDVNTAGGFLAANAARFGFTNVTSVCFNGVTVCSTPGTYFYWDSVHPTTAGHAFIAALATEYLTYQDQSVPTSAQGETALRHRAQASDAVFTHLGLGAFDPDRDGVSILIDGEEATVDARGLMPETQDDSTSFRISLDHAMSDNLMVGGMFSATKSQVDAGLVQFDSESFSLDAYIGWRSGDGLFVNAAAGASQDNYRDIERVTMVPTVINDSTTEGATYSAKIQAGWVFESGGFSISPRAAVGWVNADVEGYTEDGPMVRQVIHDRSIDAVTAEASIRFEGRMGEGMGAFLEAGYRDNLDYNADAVTASLADNPALPLGTDVAEGDGGLALVDAGFTAAVSDNISVGVAYRGRMGDELESHMGRVSVNLRF